MSTNRTFLKINMLEQFLTETHLKKQQLLTELVDNATDPTILLRRYRMISQLCDYEGQVVNKIYNLKSNDINEFFMREYINELEIIINKNA